MPLKIPQPGWVMMLTSDILDTWAAVPDTWAAAPGGTWAAVPDTWAAAPGGPGQRFAAI
jgi:hypothetical protein